MTHISQTPDSDTPNESVHHHILPPDKLDTVLQAVALYYGKQAGGLGVDANEDILLSITEATNILNKLAADALVAELEGLRIDSEVTPNGAQYIRERIEQLTAVPDLSKQRKEDK